MVVVGSNPCRVLFRILAKLPLSFTVFRFVASFRVEQQSKTFVCTKEEFTLFLPPPTLNFHLLNRVLLSTLYCSFLTFHFQASRVRRRKQDSVEWEIKLNIYTAVGGGARVLRAPGTANKRQRCIWEALCVRACIMHKPALDEIRIRGTIHNPLQPPQPPSSTISVKLTRPHAATLPTHK